MRIAQVITLFAVTAVVNSSLSAQSYLPVGPQTAVPIATVESGGWNLCFSSLYSARTGDELATIQANCTGSKLMLACGPVGGGTLTLLAQADRTEVFTDPGDGEPDSHLANGAQWYFSTGGLGIGSDSWGFAAAGDAVARDNCDVASGASPDSRLCWHLQAGAGGYRCGSTEDLNFSGDWTKSVYSNVLFSDDFEIDRLCGWSSATGAGETACPTKIYWGNYGGGTGSGSVARATIAGSSREQNYIVGGSGDGINGVAVDGAHIYWTNFLGGSIGRSDLNGSNATPDWISGLSLPIYIAVDADHVYWAENGSDSIGRADLDGNNVDATFITGLDNPYGIAVDDSYVYWTETGAVDAIGRANRADGSGVDRTFITGASFPINVAVDAAHVYWTNYDSKSIGRADLGGGNPNQAFISGLASQPTGLAVSDAYLYFAFQNASTLGRARLDGTELNESFITGALAPEGVALGD